jgi:tetratricopeptide (TPR) repeat protein
MEEEFEFGFTEDPKFSVERYEEMLRNHDQYFFDAQAFENIIDYYIEKNDPAKALQVSEYARNQHPFAAVFLIKQAQLLVVTNRASEAFAALDKAAMLEASDADIYIIRGNLYESMERNTEALENYEKALDLAEETDEILLHIAKTWAITIRQSPILSFASNKIWKTRTRYTNWRFVTMFWTTRRKVSSSISSISITNLTAMLPGII